MLKQGVAIATCLYAEHRMLKGLDNFYDTAKSKALTFAKNNPLTFPATYAKTADGFAFDKLVTKNIKNLPTIKILEKNAKHIFRDRANHLLDTPENRTLLIELVSDQKNFAGSCTKDNQWYTKIQPDGKQLWASVRNSLIRNGELNEKTDLRSFNKINGLSRVTSPNKVKKA